MARHMARKAMRTDMQLKLKLKEGITNVITDRTHFC